MATLLMSLPMPMILFSGSPRSDDEATVVRDQRRTLLVIVTPLVAFEVAMARQ